MENQEANVLFQRIYIHNEMFARLESKITDG